MPTPDHFTLLSIPPAFEIDLKALEAAYFTAQRQFHPDRFVGKPDAERLSATQRSVDVNQAYNVLKNPYKRAQYLLQMQGIAVGTEADTVKPTQDLLMEIMELREDTPPPEMLNIMIEQSIQIIANYYYTHDWKNMAQQVLRLGYLMKIAQDGQKAPRL